MDTPQVLLDHHLKTLRLPTFLREYDKARAAVRRRGRGLSALPAALERAGTAGPRTARHGTPHPPSEVRRGQEPGHLRVPGDPILK